MRDIVLITTYFRPEYLYLCLQALADAEGGMEKEYWVIHDRHSVERNHSREEEENLSVLKHFSDSGLGFQYIEMPCTQTLGNSRCTLESYLRAYKTDARFVYLVEDDILVEKDFFRWHEAVQEVAQPFCSVGWHCRRNPAYKINDDPTAFVESSVDYTSWGVCWRRENLKPIVQHATFEYYANMAGYMARVFPRSPRGFTEQDGLIQNAIINAGALVAWPCVKRAYHIGITGYHRANGYHFNGDLNSRVTQLRAAVNSGSLVDMRGDYVHLNDIDKPRGYALPWDAKDLHVVQRFV